MKVSIIIPIYNVEVYIIECLQSVANQTMTDGVECILVDDCGKDNSVKLASDFINAYKGKIEFAKLHHTCNRGLSAARNTGIKMAKGDYVYFLDSDDTIAPNCIEQLYGQVEKHGSIDLVKGSFYENGKEGETPNLYKLPDYTESKRLIKRFLLLYAGDTIPAQSKLVRKKLLVDNQLYFKEGIIHEDNYWDFFLAKHVSSMGYCRRGIYYHRYNPNSITGNVNKEKEAIAYKTIVRDLSQAIDPYLAGCQKEYILNNLITALNCGYYANDVEREDIIESFGNSCNGIERLLLYNYFSMGQGFMKQKTLHLLFRIFKL